MILPALAPLGRNPPQHPQRALGLSWQRAYGAVMRSAGQCLIKAARMDWLSDRCPAPLEAASFEMMAQDWRKIARMAARQDQYPHWLGPGLGA